MGLADQPKEDEPSGKNETIHTGNRRELQAHHQDHRSNIKKEAVARHKTSNKVLTPLTIFRIIQYQEKRQKQLSNSTDPM